MATTDTPIDALLFWAASALRCSVRLLADEDIGQSIDPAPTPTRLTQEIDAAQMLLALRNTHRAAMWLAKSRSDQTSDATTLVAEFDRMIPDVRKARDALEHFDAYAEGQGRGESPASAA